jgi:hypothetical protein
MSPILIPFGLAVLLTSDPGQSANTAGRQALAVVEIDAGARVEVATQEKTIRGRLDSVTFDALFVTTPGGQERIPLSTVQTVTRVGDPLFNGSFIGAAIGGAASVALVYKICSNTQCADTSSNLDPRLILLGTAIGTGIGALMDRSSSARTLVYRTGAGQILRIRDATSLGPVHPMILVRTGWARLTDDEGSLGHGASVGTAVTVPIRPRVGLQVEYARHTRARRLEFGGGFFGTEQLVTAKTLFYLLSGERVRPYAGLGLGFIDSTRRSELPTLPGPRSIPGPLIVYRNHTRGAVLGFAAGADARVAGRLHMLGDLTADFGSPGALASTRLTIGAGWRF